MKNHLQAVEDLYAGQKTEAGDRYVKDLYHMLNVLGEKRYTENQMLNIILNEKIREAEAKGITVTVRVGDIDLSDIKEIDLTTIFANLLDNAIEAAGRTAGFPSSWTRSGVPGGRDPKQHPAGAEEKGRPYGPWPWKCPQYAGKISWHDENGGNERRVSGAADASYGKEVRG